ncbi:MAG: bifunctional glycosyltransferase family 2/GtrA family protein [Clostridiales bacterium]|nr:bifunctional glycosyltransferase family 2/GtrA family protein [Clostridiales bacterium]
MENLEKSDVLVLIPAYKPDERLVTLTKKLVDAKFPVLLVDDGGGETFAGIFERCRALGAVVETHAVNMGKGRALKTGINRALLSFPGISAVVTADADGQHSVPDILRVAEAALEHPNALVLGCRTFSGDVPFKSRWGNRITRAVYRLASGVSVSDTQTGLRGLPARSFADMARIEGERYEYEMNVLMRLKDMNLSVFEVPIETIYIDEQNSDSHFNPVRDAIRIYRIILRGLFRYSFSAILSFVIDFALYWILLYKAGFASWLSYVLARIVSSQVNYRLNRYTVFSGRGGKTAMPKYYALAIVQGALGAGLVQVLPQILPVSAGFIKIPVDIVLFFISYQIQRDFVFRGR